MPAAEGHLLSTFGLTFSFSFLVALTGAMAPGPLLTYTIIRSLGSRRGYLMGAWVIAGHAILEMGIILCLLLGFSFVFKNIVVIRVIGVVGGVILVFFGIALARDVVAGKISTGFMDSSGSRPADVGGNGSKGFENPVVGGIAVSMSNPYWWIWWATIGLAFMVQCDISFRHWPRLLAFFLGHEAGDLIWYLIVSTLAFFGMRRLKKTAYYGILIACAIFMVLFGVYLGISPFFKNSI